MDLTIISDCKTCGLCCHGLGVPPFEYDEHGEPFEDGVIDWEIPEAALQEIREAMSHDGWQSKPCCWFDPATKLCRHYDYRPDACARFVPGNPFCQEILEDAGLSHANPQGWE